MTNRRTFLKSAGIAGTAGLTGLSGCIGSFGSDPFNDGTVQFLMSPTEPQEQMRAQYTPVRERLTESVESADDVTIDYAADYSATLNALDSQTADVAETGPFAAALGVNNEQADIILQRKAFGGWEYRSIIITRDDTDITSAEDLEGRDVAFADPLSASGSLYPLYMLQEAGLSVPDSPGSPSGADFSPTWSSHASALEALQTEQADAAGVGYFIAAGDNNDGLADGLQLVDDREGIPRAPIVVSPDLTDEEQTAITNAFTGASDTMYYGEDGEEGTEDDIWFSGVRPATVDDYQPVIDLADSLGYGQDVFES